MVLASIFISGFLNGMIHTLLVGLLARLIAPSFASGRTMRVAAFSVTLGVALGHFSYSGPISWDAAAALSQMAGCASALLALWYWLFARVPDSKAEAVE